MAKRKTPVTEIAATDAPAIDASFGDVQPVADLPDRLALAAPASDDTLVYAPAGSFVWAMARAAEGMPVKRAAWLGLKAVDFTHPSGRVILENEDFAAQDWHIA